MHKKEVYVYVLLEEYELEGCERATCEIGIYSTLRKAIKEYREIIKARVEELKSNSDKSAEAQQVISKWCNEEYASPYYIRKYLIDSDTIKSVHCLANGKIIEKREF
jgi:hypothetical protein